MSDGWVARDSTWQPIPSSPIAAWKATESMTTESLPSSPHDPNSTSSSEWEDESCPSITFRRRPNRKPLYGSRLGNRFAQKRWSSFVGSPSSRIAKTMRSRLGERLWADFVSHANRRYWPDYRHLFMPASNVPYSGPMDGSPARMRADSTCSRLVCMPCLASCISTTSGRYATHAIHGSHTFRPSRPRGTTEVTEMISAMHCLVFLILQRVSPLPLEDIHACNPRLQGQGISLGYFIGSSTLRVLCVSQYNQDVFILASGY